MNGLILDGQEIDQLIRREKILSKEIGKMNKSSLKARRLESIPGIGIINASILSIKPAISYDNAKEFAASLGLVPRQNTTGGNIKLGSITKQGDRYARTMLIQAGRSILMRCSKKEAIADDAIYQFAAKLRKEGKHFNVAAVAIANKLARVSYAILSKDQDYQAQQHSQKETKETKETKEKNKQQRNN